MEKTCCITAHRDIPKEQADAVKHALWHEVKKAAADGFTIFMSGFADGADLYFAEMVVKLQAECPGSSLPETAGEPAKKRTDKKTAGCLGGRDYHTRRIPAKRLLPPEPLYGGALGPSHCRL